ncbi:MAG: sugar phosphate isomerase/epimerase [Sedimentisphaerales bacterium]|nr:sugar phosphate isomerase/epimerase [Sedimentisphaerales bacterium]
MIESKHMQSKRISRRTFCRSAIAAGAALHLSPSFVLASQSNNRVKFYKNLGGGHIGLRANQQQALEYAVKYGFDGMTPDVGEFEDKSVADIREWVATMKAKGIRYGAAGLTVEYRRDEDRFRTDLAKLPKQATILQHMGVTRVATWISPGHPERTYLQNFEMHKTRFREIAKALKDNGIRLGLEFVGPRTSRMRNRFAFICTQHEAMELIDAIGTGNIGLLMDSWHWYTSHGTVEELLQLSNENIVHVHVNDAPPDIPVDEQRDNRRRLPTTTGVIDLKGFINALVKIGYDGPVECEPFDQELRKMPDAAKLEKTIESLNRLWNLIDA